MATENQHAANTAEKDRPEGQEVELLAMPPGAVVPGVSFGDIIRYLPVIQMLIEAIAARSGTFITKTPFGRVKVTVEPA